MYFFLTSDRCQLFHIDNIHNRQDQQASFYHEPMTLSIFLFLDLLYFFNVFLLPKLPSKESAATPHYLVTTPTLLSVPIPQ